MGVIASQITSLTIVYSTVYSDADQRKHQSSASLAFVRGIHRGPDELPAQMASYAENFPFDDAIMHARIGHISSTLCPMEYQHGFDVLRSVVVISKVLLDSYDTFTHTFQGCFTSSWAIEKVRGAHE